MERIYAQAVNGVVNLVGGKEVGLYAERNEPGLRVIDVTGFEPMPEVGWIEKEGALYEHPPDELMDELKKPGIIRRIARWLG